MKQRKQKVLIIDDTVANIKILGEALSSQYEILIATNGHKGIQVAQTQYPDIILLDIMMPEMDGYMVCKILKADRLTKNIPIIFITAMNQEENEAKGLEIGAIDYITKPFSLAIVKARVKNHLALKEYQEHLEMISTTDGLTQIPNRRRFDECLDLEWRRALRTPSPLSLIMMDVDFFKQYNDSYGHLSGDDCLRKVAQALRDSLNRPGDLAARYGGEEFVCLLPDTNEAGALSVAKAIQHVVSNLQIPHEYSSISGYVTLSFGLTTTIPSNESSPAAFVQTADQLLYEAKRAGRNQIKTNLGTNHDLPLNQPGG